MNVKQWLLIQTPDGATYLQVIILLVLFFLLVKYIARPICKEVTETIKEECRKTDDT